MARPMGSKNKPKEAEIGHNTGALTDDQLRALFLQNLNKIKRLKAEVATATANLRNAFKIAKSDGITKKDLDFAFLLESLKEDEAIDTRRRETQVARWLGHPIGTQPDLFEQEGMPSGEKAYEEGKISGMKGEDCNSPYQGELEQEWIRGWHDGQAAITSIKELKTGTTLIKANRETSDPDGAAFDSLDDNAVNQPDALDEVQGEEQSEVEASAGEEAPQTEEGGTTYAEQLAETNAVTDAEIKSSGKSGKKKG